MCDDAWGSADTPEFAHLPLIDAADGRRMAKRLNSLDLGAMRERGDDPACRGRLLRVAAAIGGRAAADDAAGAAAVVLLGSGGSGYRRPRDGWWVAVPLSSRVARSGHARSVRTLTLCDRDLSFQNGGLGGGDGKLDSLVWRSVVCGVVYVGAEGACGGALSVVRWPRVGRDTGVGVSGVCRVSAQVGARDGAGRPGGRAAASVPRGVREALLEACASGGDDADRGGGSGGRGPVGRGTLEAQDVARGDGSR